MKVLGPLSFWADYIPGWNGTWSKQGHANLAIGPMRLHLSGSLSRTKSRTGAPLCYCCEDGYYCRHRCPMHPKAKGLADSGKPWAA